MALASPAAGDPMDSPSHSKLHRIIDVDVAEAEGSLYVDGGDVNTASGVDLAVSYGISSGSPTGTLGLFYGAPDATKIVNMWNNNQDSSGIVGFSCNFGLSAGMGGTNMYGVAGYCLSRGANSNINAGLSFVFGNYNSDVTDVEGVQVLGLTYAASAGGKSVPTWRFFYADHFFLNGNTNITSYYCYDNEAMPSVATRCTNTWGYHCNDMTLGTQAGQYVYGFHCEKFDGSANGSQYPFAYGDAGSILWYINRAGDMVLQTYSDATRPAAGVAGRVIYNSTDSGLNVDDGANWRSPTWSVT